MSGLVFNPNSSYSDPAGGGSFGGPAPEVNSTPNYIQTDPGPTTPTSPRQPELFSDPDQSRLQSAPSENTLTTNTSEQKTPQDSSPPGNTNPTSPANSAFNQTAPSTSTGLPPSAYAGLPNVLHQFTSYNYLMTLSALGPAAKNSPNMYYKQGAAANRTIIARSQGDWANAGARAPTTYGQFDYYIDDLSIVSVVEPNLNIGVTTGLKISFKVTEPYSIGLFLQALQQASFYAGNQGPYQHADYLLAIEFIGYRGEVPTQPGETAAVTKYIPINILNCSMKVTQSGAVYDCVATTSNQRAFGQMFGTTQNQVKLSGDTVSEILTGPGESLVMHFRKQYEEEKVKRGLNATDSIQIVFPADFSQPGNSGNPMQNSRLFDNLSDNGTVPMPNNNSVWDPNKKIYNNQKVTISEKKNFHFKKDLKIEEIITEIILRSKYCVEQVVPQLRVDSAGMINWFRIEAQVFDGPFIPKYNRHAHNFVYRVIPYKVHAGKFVPPNVQPPGYAGLKAQAAKVYNYLYTGKNIDILNVDLTFKMAFLRDQPFDFGNRSDVDIRNQNGLTAGTVEPEYTQAQSPTPTKGLEPTVPVKTTGSKEKSYGTSAGGSGSDSKETKQVRSFHQRILQSDDDMIKIDLEIMGDPYFLPDSGLGNQLVPPRSLNLLQDGSMNYQGGEVDIILNFSTPIDIDTTTGLYKFGKPIDQFSGLYNVLRVESKFNQGKFTQVITASRRPQQIEGTISPTSSYAPNGISRD